MNPETLKKIKESPFFGEFKDYLVSEVQKINRVDDLQQHGTPTEIALEAKSRQKAVEVLIRILSGFASAGEFKGTNRQEYVA